MAAERRRNFGVVIACPENISAEEVSDYVRPLTSMSSFGCIRGQVEKSARGFCHLQLALHLTNGMSLASISKKLESAEIVPIEDFSNYAKEYCLDVSKRLPGTEAVEIGKAPKDTTDFYMTLDQCSTREAAIAFFNEPQNARKRIRERQSIMTYIDSKFPNDVSAKKFSANDFQVPLLNWRHCGVEVDCWLLTGLSGIGKTQYALAHFEKPCVITQVNDWRNFSDLTDGLVFDDISFSKWTFDKLLALFCSDKPVRQNVKFDSRQIPVGMKRIITCNSAEQFWPRPTNTAEERQLMALRRRVGHTELAGHYLFKGNNDHKTLMTVLSSQPIVYSYKDMKRMKR